MDDLISRQAAIDAIGTWDKFGADERGRIVRWHEGLVLYVRLRDVLTSIVNLPSAQPQTGWNNHTVACLLAELFGDDCACNFNSIDEWLPEKCEVIDTCPNPVGVACWEQFLKHRAERRTDE